MMSSTVELCVEAVDVLRGYGTANVVTEVCSKYTPGTVDAFPTVEVVPHFFPVWAVEYTARSTSGGG